MSLATNKSRRVMACLGLVGWCAFAGTAAMAWQERRAELEKMFEKREVMIPVRDGVKLHTEIYTPKNA